MNRLDRLLRPPRQVPRCSSDVADVCYTQPRGNPDKIADVALVANVAGEGISKHSSHPTNGSANSLEQNFKSSPPATSAIVATFTVLPSKPNGFDVATPCYTAATNSVFLDFETRTTGGCNLKLSGAWRYAADPATEIITLTYRLSAEQRRLWIPALGRCDLLAELAANPKTVFVSHAGFEQADLARHHGRTVWVRTNPNHPLA